MVFDNNSQRCFTGTGKRWVMFTVKLVYTRIMESQDSHS